MTAHVQQASVLSGRSMTMLVVIGLHALVISALIAMKFVPPLIDPGPRPFELVNDPPEVVPPPEAPVPKPQKLERFEVVVPVIEPLDIVVTEETLVVEASPPQEADTGPAQIDSGPATATVITAPPVRVFTELAYTAVMSPDVFYPATSIALQEQGVAVVNVCVGGNGRMEGQPVIQTSSGYKRLDQAATKWAREALRFTPATENGAAVRACKGFRVVFNLN
jgi:periplasmic protein TonB